MATATVRHDDEAVYWFPWRLPFDKFLPKILNEFGEGEELGTRKGRTVEGKGKRKKRD